MMRFREESRSVFLTVSFLCFVGLVSTSMLASYVSYPLIKLFGFSWETREGFTGSLVVSGVLSVIAGIVNVFLSASLYGLALQEVRNNPVTFGGAIEPWKKPGRLVVAAITGSLAAWVPSMAIWYYLPSDYSTPLSYAVFILTGPFYLFVLPDIIERGVSVQVAARDNVKLGFREYKSLFRVFTDAVFRSWLGIVLCLIGFIWTQPNYQIIVAREYLRRKSSDEPVPLD